LFTTNGLTRATVTFDGNTLINTTTDTGHRLTVSGSGASGSVNLDNTLYVSGSRVGVGMSNPAYNLDISGSARLTSTSATRFLIDTTNASPNTGFGLSSNNTLRWSNAAYRPSGTNLSYVIFNDQTGTDSLFIQGDTNNVIIGSSTDAGFKLDVNGTARIQGNTTVTGTIGIGSGASFLSLSGAANNNVIQGTQTIEYRSGGSSINRAYHNFTNSLTFNPTADFIPHVNMAATFAPTSGTGTYTQLFLYPTINQTGGANGITRGLHIQPTLTAAPNFRAIETTTGSVILNGGNVGIGTSTPSASLHISGSSGSALFEIDSPALNNILFVTGSGRVGIGTGNPARTLDIQSPQSVVRVLSTTNTNSCGLVFNNFAGDFWIGRDSSVGNGFGMASPAYAGVINARGNYPLYIGRNDSNDISIFTTGNIGINTTTDAGYKLDVNGTARVSGVLTCGNNVTAANFIGNIRSDLFLTSNGGFYIFQSSGATGNAKFNQFVSIGTNSEPVASAALDVVSTTKGFLPPRMTGAQAELISSPAEGLMVYATDGTGVTITSKGWWGYDGATWVKFN
jgi:hypothetical protein